MTRSRRGKGRLPAEVTTLVGRLSEVAEVKQVLRSARLVTLIGPGGIGKSRVALRAAAEMTRSVAAGAWHVDLAGTMSGSLLEYAVTDALGLQGDASRPVAEVIDDYLRDRELLLLLDGCEHLVDACAVFVDRVLRVAPGLRVLCTSRQPLGIIGEHVRATPPLAVPETPEAVSLGNGSGCDAVDLLVERAAAAVPGFTLNAGNRQAVVEICHRLDGMPLAIEHAAARLRTMSVDQVLDALGASASLRLLTTRFAEPARHRSVERTHDWSYRLCSPEEQTLWTRVWVFPGSFTVSAAEFVCRDAVSHPDAVRDALAGLVDKSALTRFEDDLGVRFRMLGTAREYGADQLRGVSGVDGERALRRVQRDWCLGLVERFEAAWFGPRQVEWRSRLLAEKANVWAALEYCLSVPEEHHAALRIATGMRSFWSCGMQREGKYWLGRVLAVAPHNPVAQLTFSTCLIGSGEHAEAQAYAQSCLDAARSRDDSALIASALSELGASALFLGEFELALVSLQEASARFAELGKKDTTVMMAWTVLAKVLELRGETERAAAIQASCIATCEAAGEKWWYAMVKLVAGKSALDRGELTLARRHVRDALQIHLSFRDRVGVVHALDEMMAIASVGGEHRRAARLAGCGTMVWTSLGMPRWAGRPWRERYEDHIGRVRAALGSLQYEQAMEWGTTRTFDEACAYALGQAPLPAARDDDVSRSPLTAREREVAVLVAEGLSNREIAEQLTVSPRTAASHVENILRKLGLSSRAQIVAWVVHQV